MIAPSQEENTNPNETRFVSHSAVSLAYTSAVTPLARLGRDWLKSDLDVLGTTIKRLHSTQSGPTASCATAEIVGKRDGASPRSWVIRRFLRAR
jgi:hypothetical protein